MATVGIFDTGFGGHYVAERLRLKRPHDVYHVVDDHKHLPYGSRTPEEIFTLTNAAIQPLLKQADVIVIACNTATTLAIDQLRQAYPDITFVGFEPMVKTAAEMTKSHKIAILATPATVNSDRYQGLKAEWANGCKVFEPDCSNWASQIEAEAFNPAVAERVVQDLTQNGVDVISLACTHYLYLKDALQAAVGQAAVIIDPLEAVNRQIDHVLSETAPRQ
jgi:glutamate racemase